ncbi:TspO/MBR family protein [Planctomycetota bacterium]
MKLGTKDVLALVVCLALCFGAAAIGSLFTGPAVSTWFQQIRKPSYSPPDWLFGPVWTALYATMAVAAWLIWRKGDAASRRLPLFLFGVQLALNAAWSPIFFGLRSFGGAFVEIVALWLAILATLVAFLPVSVPAGVLLVPYLGWVSFAAVLNFSIWRLNQ